MPGNPPMSDQTLFDCRNAYLKMVQQATSGPLRRQHQKHLRRFTHLITKKGLEYRVVKSDIPHPETPVHHAVKRWIKGHFMSQADEEDLTRLSYDHEEWYGHLDEQFTTLEWKEGRP